MERHVFNDVNSCTSTAAVIKSFVWNRTQATAELSAEVSTIPMYTASPELAPSFAPLQSWASHKQRVRDSCEDLRIHVKR